MIRAFDLVDYEKRDQVAWITINNPDRLNAISRGVNTGLHDSFTEAERDDNVRVVVLTGAGGHAFCAGADLKEMAARGSTPYVFHGVHKVSAVLKPVIAAIDGYALAGGMQLSARCDFRVATEQSVFGQPEPLRGLSPVSSMDTQEMGFVPLGWAKWIMMSGDHITAAEAHRIGFVQWLVPDRDAMLAEAEHRADILKRAAPLAVQAVKSGIHLHMNPPTPPPAGVALLDHLRTLNEPRQARLRESTDNLEGPRAFAEKRSATWKGA